MWNTLGIALQIVIIETHGNTKKKSNLQKIIFRFMWWKVFEWNEISKLTRHPPGKNSKRWQSVVRFGIGT